MGFRTERLENVVKEAVRELYSREHGASIIVYITELGHYKVILLENSEYPYEVIDTIHVDLKLWRMYELVPKCFGDIVRYILQIATGDLETVYPA